MHPFRTTAPAPLALGCVLAFTLATGAAGRVVHAAGTVDATGQRPAGDPAGTVWLHSGQLIAPGELVTGASLGFALNPLIGRAGGEKADAAVDHRLALHLAISAGVTDRAQVGIGLPFVLFQGGRDLALHRRRDLTAVALGDLEVVPKIGILRSTGSGVDLALVPAVTFPTGTTGALAGDGSLTFAPVLALSVPIEPVTVLANLGVRVRRETRAVDLELGHELLYRAGVRVETPAGGLYATGEIAGATRAAHPFSRAAESPLEGLVGLRYTWADAPLTLGLAGGAGLVPGYGSPTLRIVAGLGYTFAIPGTDLADRRHDATTPDTPDTDALPAAACAEQAPGPTEETVDVRDVHFVEGAARLDETRSAAALDALARRVRCTAVDRVDVRVAVPANGSPELARVLAEARAQSVARALRAREVWPERIRGAGEATATGTADLHVVLARSAVPVAAEPAGNE
jgi:hypothetical protein